MIPEQYISNPKYFEIVRRGTGLLQGSLRFERIKNIASKNIILSVRCKNTCIDDEENVCDYILSIAYDKIIKDEDAASIIAILELGEYMILGDILKEKYQVKIIEKKLIKFVLENEPYYNVLRFLSAKIPKEITKNIFHLIRTNGITVNIEYYNALLNISSKNESWDIYVEMKQFGVTPNDITFNILFINCEELIKAEEIFADLKEISSNKRVWCTALTKIISLCDKYDKAFSYYTQLENIIEQEEEIADSESNENEINNQKNKTKLLLRALPYIIKLSESEEVAFSFYKKAKEISTKKNSFQLFFQYCRKINRDSDLEKFISENVSFFKTKDSRSISGEAFNNFDTILNFIVTERGNGDLIFSILQLMEAHGYKPPYYYLSLILTQFKDENLVRLCISRMKEVDFDKENVKLSYFTSLINNSSFEIGKLLFDIIKEKGYEVNEIVYNVLIKKAETFLQGYNILSKMEKEGLVPDKFSFAPLFRKADNIETIFDLISSCSRYKILPDENFIQILSGIAFNNSEEFSKVFISRSKSLFIDLDSKWFEIINRINIESTDNKIFDCEVVYIVPSRVFVKIENELRKCSIYIGELTDERLANILDFEYNGEKLHIGQKMKAQLINTDEMNRLNLSIKKVKNK